MLGKKIQLSSLFIIGTFMIILGILSILQPLSFIKILYFSLSIGLPIIGIYNMISIYFSKNNPRYKIASFIDAFALFIAGIILCLHPIDVLTFTPYVIGFYSFLKAVICGFNYYVYYLDHLKGKLFILFEAFVNLVMSITLVIHPLFSGKLTLTFLGIYFIVYGTTQFFTIEQVLFPNRKKHYFKMTMPIFIDVLLPQKLVYTINRILNEQGPNSKELSPIKKDNLPYNMEILIHLGSNGFDSVGHVDIAFSDIVLSYGCHDHHNTRFAGVLGPGVIHFNEKTNYLDFVVNQRNKQIVGFGIHLTKDQKIAVKKTLIELASRFEHWYTDYDKKANNEPYEGDCLNYASLLSKFCHSKFYKFSNGKFKTYFVMTTNCVLLVDTILGKSGIDLLKINGIITPGSYYEFLNNEFLLPKSNVVYRNIYTKETISTMEKHNDLANKIHDMRNPVEFINEYILKE